MVEAPTYLGVLQAFTVYGADYVRLPSHDDGLRSDLLEKPLRSGPKFMYVLPNFQNPGDTFPREGAMNSSLLLTSTEFRSSKTTPTANSATRVNTSLPDCGWAGGLPRRK